MEAQLRAAYEQSLAPNPELIKQAEAFLKTASGQPGYGIGVLKLVAAADVPVQVRQAAAVGFKNHVKFSWAPREPADGGPPPAAVPEPDKAAIREHITELMLSAPPRVRAQLSEALALISAHDFPTRWPSLLPQLVAKLSDAAAPVPVLAGVLGTAESIYGRYRGQYLTPELASELEYSQALVRPLLGAVQRLAAAAAAAAAAAPAPPELPETLAAAASGLAVFYSLNSPGLTDEFEATLDEWMAVLHTLLALEAPGLAAPPEDEEGPLDALKATACECLALFMERNEEEFARFLPTFVQAVWTQLLGVGPAPGRDRLAMRAVGFLTAVARSVHYALFGDAGALRQVCEGIVVPALRLRPADEETFEDNWVEWVRRDTEGGDADTRRRAAAELVRALVDRFPQQATALFSGYVDGMLAEAAADPGAAWRAKDCALYLVAAVAAPRARAAGAAAGAAATNALVPLPEFFAAHVAPELADAACAAARPVIAADALRFATAFRGALPPAALVAALPHVVRLLGAASNVVHTYAAIAVERLLAARAPGGGGGPLLPADALAPLAAPLLEGLFGALRLPDSAENEYVARAVARVAAYYGAAGVLGPLAAPALAALAAELGAAAGRPGVQPAFVHHLFEAAAAVVRLGVGAEPGGLAAAEAALFPPFQAALAADAQELHPYVFQVLALLLEARPPGGAALPPAYAALLPPLLAPTLWERPANVPALARLLCAYADASAPALVAGGHLPAVLGVFQKLAASKAHDHEGLALLTALTRRVDPAALQPFMPAVWGVLFSRLQAARTPKFVRALVVFCASLAAARGGAALAASVDAVQPGLARMVAAQVWAPALAAMPRAGADFKVVAVGTAKLLSEAPALQDEAGAPAWGALAAALAAWLGADGGAGGAGAPPAAAEGDDDDAGASEFGGYSAAYAALQHAKRPERDPVPDVADARAAAAGMLAAWAAAHLGRAAAAAAAAGAPPEQQAALAAMCGGA